MNLPTPAFKRGRECVLLYLTAGNETECNPTANCTVARQHDRQKGRAAIACRYYVVKRGPAFTSR